MKLTKQDYGIGFRIVSVLCAALLGGMLWRIRGARGFGSMWGMFVVAAGFSLYAFSIFGERKKIQYALFPWLVILTGITAGGWGTLNSQMSGQLGASALFAGEEAIRIIDVNPWSGLFLMLCLGFGWMPFFAYFFGYYFSSRKYKFKELAIGVVVFYVAYNLFKATLSHLIVQQLCTDATRLFKEGLADRSLDTTPWGFVLKNLVSDSAAKKIPGGRNYYASVAAVSAALATGALCLYQRLKLKDKIASYITCAISGVVALAITIADIPMIAGAERALIKAPALHNFFKGSHLWSLWEYGTGFFIGLGVMTIFHMVHKKGKRKELYIKEAFPSIRGVPAIIYYSLVGLFAPLCLTIIRPLGLRLDRDEGVLAYAVIAGLGSVAFLVCLLIVWRNLCKEGPAGPIKTAFKKFSANAFIIYFLIVCFLYFFVGESAPILTSNYNYIIVMMIVSFFALMVLNLVVRKRSETA